MINVLQYHKQGADTDVVKVQNNSLHHQEPWHGHSRATHTLPSLLPTPTATPSLTLAIASPLSISIILESQKCYINRIKKDKTVKKKKKRYQV
jgi:hypothetical protein